ncbi:MAG TPA: HAD family phosphatase [Bryobacteraceae bacterium]
MKYDSILFDFDGVLVDSEPVHWRAWAEVLRPHGIDLDWETYRRIAIGVSDPKLFELFGALAHPPVESKVVVDEFRTKQQIFLRLMRSDTGIAPGVAALVKSLQNYRLALVTSSFLSEVEPVLDAAGIRPCFAAVIASEDVAAHKPAPDPYLTAALRLGARRPLVVEDSDAGVESARAAGFDVIRVAGPDELADAVRTALTK